MAKRTVRTHRFNGVLWKILYEPMTRLDGECIYPERTLRINDKLDDKADKE